MKTRSNVVLVLMIFITIATTLVVTGGNALAATGTKVLRINDTTLKFKEVIYVDSANGNDITGDGSIENPFQTVFCGFEYLGKYCREDGAIVLKEGTYDVANLFKGTWNNLNPQYVGMKLSLIAETMGKVQFTNVDEWIVVENDPAARIKISQYGIIFKNAYKTEYALGGDDWTNEYYNCVFIAKYGGWNGAVPSANIKVENCLFIGDPNINCFTTNPLSGTAINCASTTKFIEPYKGLVTTSLYNVNLDDNYNIDGESWKNAGIGTNPDGTKANIGVYGGQFAWGSKIYEVKKTENILKVVLSVAEELQLSVDEDLATNVNLFWSSSNEEVATVNQEGVVTAIKPGNTEIIVKNKLGTYVDKINVLVVDDADNYRLAMDLKIGKTGRLTIDDYTFTKNVIWSTMNSEIATINNRGKIIAVGEGLTLAIATDEQGKRIGQIYIRVRK